mmetsp:Transcript_4360/g.6636  ORF Transcript_4360/g.6636 Transcript_4360/m.6636 type:complete len:316 (-) Transcript_4360:25-972(-)
MCLKYVVWLLALRAAVSFVAIKSFRRSKLRMVQERRGGAPTLPSGDFRPKQSLGQNFLCDRNYIYKICDSFRDESENGRTVIELGSGAGALTEVLFERYSDMIAVDIDQRSIELLSASMPKLGLIQSDVLQINYSELAKARGGKLNVIGNLPYHITSQILFMLCDHHRCINKAVVTLQLEVAQRIVASPNTKEYGILSVVYQLYAVPKILFKIPPTAFYPQPKVMSALVGLNFTGKGPNVNEKDLKKVIGTSFQQRRKMLRQSLKPILDNGKSVPEKFSTMRPEQLDPQQFVELTKAIFGESRAENKPVWRSIKV